MRSIVVVLCLLAWPAWAGTPAPPFGADASLSGADTDLERTLAGGIGARSHDLVTRWLRANPHRALTLHLDSPGGLAVFGSRLHDAIQAHGQVATDVQPGQLCLSACGYLWLAGRTRTVAERGFLGFHSAFCTSACDGRGIGFINQSLLDILARTEPALAVMLSNTGAMISGRSLIALATREHGHWAVRTVQPPS